MKLLRTPLSRRRALALLGALPVAYGVRSEAASPPQVIVHRDPSCGCCGAWAEHLRRAGFAVKIVESGNLNAIKQRLQVPADLISCHTAEVAGYVIEGHVPAGAIHRLLSGKPHATRPSVPRTSTSSPRH